MYFKYQVFIAKKWGPSNDTLSICYVTICCWIIMIYTLMCTFYSWLKVELFLTF